MDAEKPAFRTRLPPIFTVGNMTKGQVLQLPWEHQNEHFVRDFLQFSHFVASKSTFSYEFSLEHEMKICYLKIPCFVRNFRQFSAHRTKCHACHGICTLSPLDAALPMRFAINTQHDTSKVLRLPRKMTMDTSKVLRLPRKMQHIF